MNKHPDIFLFEECCGEHSHEYPQILVPLQKSMEVCIGDTYYTVTAQELCLVPAGMRHECSFHGQLLAINLSADMADIQELANLSYPIVVSMQGQIMQLVELIQSEAKQNPDGHSLRHLYSYLYSKLLDNCAPPSIRYISEHYDGQPARGDGKLQYHLLQRLVQTADRPVSQPLPAQSAHCQGEGTAAQHRLRRDGYCVDGRLQQQRYIYPRISQHHRHDAKALPRMSQPL